jgi:ribonuclease HII
METMETTAGVYNIYFNEEINTVVMEWDGYATSDQFKEGTELMLNTLIENKAVKVLADIKDMVLIGTEDQQWLHSSFLPRAIKFGFKAIAIIKPDSYFNKVAVESISYKVDSDKLLINFFDNVNEAKEWLKKI